MDVRITSRGTTLPQSLRDRTVELLSKPDKYGARISAVEVVFEEEKNSKKIEVILRIDGRDTIVASGEGNDFNEALSQVNDRLRRHLRKLRTRVTDHRAPSLTKALAEE